VDGRVCSDCHPDAQLTALPVPYLTPIPIFQLSQRTTIDAIPVAQATIVTTAAVAMAIADGEVLP
jgi:hypothetical protein